MRPFGRSFLPGPVDVHPEVLEATLQPYYFPFSERMQHLLAEMQPRLQRLFGTRQTILFSVSAATGLMMAGAAIAEDDLPEMTVNAIGLNSKTIVSFGDERPFWEETIPQASGGKITAEFVPSISPASRTRRSCA